MTKFMDKDFLLSTETEKKLYHNVAETLPIIDYHCHINPKDIYDDVRFDTISVKAICTTDEPADDLHYHTLIAEDPTINS